MNENMLPVGTVLRGGAYRIERQIAAGGFGNTYVVRSVKFGNLYAMKEFFMKGINLRQGSDVTVSISDNKSTFETQREKFEKEAVRLHDLDNKHIVKVHDLFDENGTVYYVMDYIDGQPLSDIVKAKGPMSEKEALNIFRQMLDALSVVHGQDKPMLHLDIKPSNIMLNNAGNAYLIDFGSSKQIDDTGSLTTVSGFTLSKDYAPTELIGGVKDRIGPWTDLYELGGTLYYLLTGSKPPTSSELSMERESSFTFPDNISSSTCKLILWMMALAPSNRPKSVEEVLSRMEGSGTAKDTKTKSPGPEPKKPEESERPTTGPDDDETVLSPSGSDSSSIILNPSGSNGGDKPKVNPQTSKVVGRSGGSSYKNLSILFVAVIIGIMFAFFAKNSDESKDRSQPPVEEVTDETEDTYSQLSPVIQNLINNMVYVEGGTFTMGATSEQGSDAYDRDKPAHQVTLSSYSIGKYEVTQEEWKAVMGSNPSKFKGAKRPVEMVSWDDCQEFIRKLNAMTGKRFRLPTEAEWEFAARGGNNSRGYKYAGSSNIDNVAWYEDNSYAKGENSSEYGTHNVGTKSPNELGIYDMSGNVWEWCEDWYGDYSSSRQTDPKGSNSGYCRVGRGGSWDYSAGHCRVSNRIDWDPAYRINSIGLRLAL